MSIRLYQLDHFWQTEHKLYMVEVVVRCEVVGHIAEDDSIFKYREDGVHPRLTVGVVSPVTVHCHKDRKEIGHQQNLLVA